MLSVILLALCMTAVLTQVAVLRDPSIAEHEIVESLRYLRIAAYALTAVYTSYLIATGYWLQPPLAMALVAVSLADTAGAAGRLFPDVLAPHGNGK